MKIAAIAKVIKDRGSCRLYRDWVTDWEVTTDFNGFPLKYPRVIDLCPQCRAMYGKRPLGVGGKIQHHV